MRALMLEGEWEEVQRHLPSLPKWQYLSLTHMFNAIAPADRDNIFAPLLRANLEQFKDPTPGDPTLYGRMYTSTIGIRRPLPTIS